MEKIISFVYLRVYGGSRRSGGTTKERENEMDGIEDRMEYKYN